MANRFLALLSALMLMTAGANAATIDLTYGGDLSISGGTGTFEVDGVSGRVTAHSMATWRPRISQYRRGIGIYSGRHDDTAQLDGLFNEWLSFTFDTAVRLISVTFSHVDRHDDWDIYMGRRRIANDSNHNPFYFGERIASAFSVVADGHNCSRGYCYSDDNFVIRRFTVAPVPLPASALLLIGGLAGLGLMRRRKLLAT